MFNSESLAALRVVGKERPKVNVPDLPVVVLERFPRRQPGQFLIGFHRANHGLFLPI
jgi:hypothetical protein